MKFLWQPRTIEGRLVFTMCTLLLAMVLFVVIYFPLRDRRNAVRNLQSQAVAVAKLVAYEVAPALQGGNQAQVRDVLTGAALEEDLTYLAVYRADGGLFAAWERTGAHAPKHITWGGSTGVGAETGQVVITLPLGGAHRLGGLRGAFSTAGIEADAQREGVLALGLGAATLALGYLNARAFAARFRRRINRIIGCAQELAAGDLRVAPLSDTSSDELGILAQAVNQILGHQQNMVRALAAMALEIKRTSVEILQSAEQQEQGAAEQASAVHETRQTMAQLLQSGRQISQSAYQVLHSAEKTQSNNQLISDRISALSTHIQRITEILEVIKDIANKSELLALNASLEGTKAGETGRGFSLVASQMQRLAENIMGAVRDIKGLTGDVHNATQASVLATEDGTSLAANTTHAARQIGSIITQQQTGTEQVTRAMDDVAQIAQQNSMASRSSVRTTQALAHLSKELEDLVHHFRTAFEDERAP